MRGQLNDREVFPCRLPLLENDSDLLFKKQEFRQFPRAQKYNLSEIKSCEERYIFFKKLHHASLDPAESFSANDQLMISKYRVDQNQSY